MGLISNLKLALAVKRAKDTLEKESRMYDVKTTLLKGFKSLAITAGAAAAAAAVGVLLDPAAVSAVLQNAGVSAALIATLVPLFTAAARMVENYIKNAHK